MATIVTNVHGYMFGGAPDYVVLTTTALVDSITALTGAKEARGFTVGIVRLDGSGGSEYPAHYTLDNEGLLDFTDYIYRNWRSTPSHILIVGNITDVPWTQSDYQHDPGRGDFNYSDPDGDRVAEFYLARIASSDPATVQAMCNLLADNDTYHTSTWTNEILLTAHQEDAPGKYVFDANQSYAALTAAGYDVSKGYAKGYSPYWTGWQGQCMTRAEVLSAVEAGKSVVSYRGHGSITAWIASWTGGSITAYDIQSLDVTPYRYPAVFCIACQNMSLWRSHGFCYEWSLKSPYVVGATMNSFTTTNSIFFRALHSAMVGGMTRGGEVYQWANHECVRQGATNNSRIYMALGDPDALIIGGTSTPAVPVLSLSTDALSFGLTHDNLAFDVSNTGDGYLTWAIPVDSVPSWITEIYPSGGVEPSGETSSVNVSVSREGLGAAHYEYNLQVNSDGGNDTVLVNMDVYYWSTHTEQSAYVAVPNVSHVEHYGYTTGTLHTAISTEQYGYVRGTQHISTSTEHAGYMNVISESSVEHYAYIPNAGGTYLEHSAYLKGIPEEPPPPPDPELYVNPSGLDFGTATVSRTFNVYNIGAGTLAWGVSGWTEAWVSGVVPVSGINEDTVSVSVDRTGLPSGTYTDTLDVLSDYGNVVVSLSMGVTYTEPTPSGEPFVPTETIIYTPAGNITGDSTFLVANVGSGDLSWYISSTQPTWMALDKASGTLTGGETELVTVSVDSTGLDLGTYRHTIRIGELTDMDGIDYIDPSGVIIYLYVEAISAGTPVNMTTRNIRYRYPICSELISDTFDEIYYNIVELLGYQNELGVVAVSGTLRELWGELSTRRVSSFGSSASGIQEAYVRSSGSSDYSSIHSIYHDVLSMINNPMS